jgi:hypothetical protein
MWSKCPSIASKDKAGITQIHIFADSTLIKFMHQPSGAKEAPRFPKFIGFREQWDLS